ncbi:MAG: hypothetical protein JW769_01605 [Parachlamydiales bacterium]|nr:hypothetical protein [Parachlamydiales bacterium]
MKNFYVLLLLLFFFYIPLPIYTDQFFTISPNIFFRMFHEHFSDDRKSDEYGLHYGGMLGYEKEWKNRQFSRFRIGAAYGNVRYDGTLVYNFYETIPFRSTTDSTILTIEGLQGHIFLRKKWQFIPLLGAEYYRWEREAKNLEECFSWISFLGGLHISYRPYKNSFGVDIKGGMSTFCDMEIRRGLSAFTKLSLKNRPQIYTSFPLNIFLQQATYLQCSPYFIYRGIGGSKHSYQSGIRMVSFPSSQCIEMGLLVTLFSSF